MSNLDNDCDDCKNQQSMNSSLDTNYKQLSYPLLEGEEKSINEDSNRTTHSPQNNSAENEVAASSNIECVGKNVQNNSLFSLLKSLRMSIFKIFLDQSGTCRNISYGMLVMLFFGTILGILIPKNDELPNPWYRDVSSVVGYTYFTCWSVSFYPQIITNYQQGSIDGLSTDYAIMLLINYACYAAYNVSFFWNKGIRKEYKDWYGPDSEVAVQSNDVAFAIHALVLAFALNLQIIYYGGFKSKPLSRFSCFLITGILLLCIVYVIFILRGYKECNWMVFLYMLAIIKLLFSVTSYVPQLMYNSKRKSTVGWNVWQVFLDFSGGFLSLLQLILDSVDLRDFSGIEGNWAKFLLGVFTLIFDTAFLLQHFVFYRQDESGQDRPLYDTISDYDSLSQI